MVFIVSSSGGAENGTLHARIIGDIVEKPRAYLWIVFQAAR